jgi:hypothetical protein
MYPRVMILELHLFVFLRGPSLRSKIIVKKLDHGTETTKLCQEFVYPVESFEYCEKYI